MVSVSFFNVLNLLINPWTSSAVLAALKDIAKFASDTISNASEELAPADFSATNPVRCFCN